MFTPGTTWWPDAPLVVEVAGPLACFTRPELKVERVSYPVMTPSAAVGVLEAIFWKPEIRYVITAIEVLSPIEWISVRRNEVNSTVTSQTVKDLRAGWRYDVGEDRTQRHTTALRDVAYRIHAQMLLADHATEPVSKYRAQLRRRTVRGACFQQPYLGLREFTCRFGPRGMVQSLGPEDRNVADRQPIDRTEELGVMLHSITYHEGGTESYSWFRARLEHGRLDIPLAPLGADEVWMPSTGWRVAAEGEAG